MDAIEVSRLHPVDVPHARGEIAADGFREQVVVIARKTEGMAPPVESLDCLFRILEETCLVSLIFKDRHRGVSSRRHMIHGPG
jgi:hypothetical protein